MVAPRHQVEPTNSNEWGFVFVQCPIVVCEEEIKDDVDGCEFPNLDCGVVVEGERDVWGGIYELSKTVSFGGVKVVHIGKEL